MPLVWQALPNVPLMIVGDEWPAALPWARDERIRMVGRIRRLADVFDLVRLTVAPLRFGAGLKGKVLDSFAAGIPCVMSPVAAEAMPLCPTLQTLVGEDAAGMAAQIVRLHSDAGAAIACRNAGLSMVETAFSAEAVAQALASALGPKRARSARRKVAAGPSPKSPDARTDAAKRRSAPGH
jgi:glycosyltransferase involved in cell wall biosynthesis